MNATEYPLIGNVVQVDVPGSWGRAMLNDARHKAPAPCRTCSHLSLARDNEIHMDVLHCNGLNKCPHVLEQRDLGQLVFFDITPYLGSPPSDSPCIGCSHATTMNTKRGVINYCGRADKKQSYCTVRGDIMPDEWCETQDERAQEKANRECDSELRMLDAMDYDDYGSF